MLERIILERIHQALEAQNPRQEQAYQNLLDDLGLRKGQGLIDTPDIDLDLVPKLMKHEDLQSAELVNRVCQSLPNTLPLGELIHLPEWAEARKTLNPSQNAYLTKSLNLATRRLRTLMKKEESELTLGDIRGLAPRQIRSEMGANTRSAAYLLHAFQPQRILPST